MKTMIGGMQRCGEGEPSWKIIRNSPQAQIIIAGKIIMQLDPVLKGLRCRMSEAKRGLVLPAQWRTLLGLIHRHLVLDDTVAGTNESRETYSG